MSLRAVGSANHILAKRFLLPRFEALRRNQGRGDLRISHKSHASHASHSSYVAACTVLSLGLFAGALLRQPRFGVGGRLMSRVLASRAFERWKRRTERIPWLEKEIRL
jgi:hypothetical protein